MSAGEAYGRDLAYVHDTGFGGFARSAAPALLRRLSDAGLHGGLVVDLGCGSGIWARTLLDAGYGVLGVDASADLLAIARERAPSARFVHGSLFDAELPAGCAAVTAIGECLSYAVDARAGRESVAALLRRIHAALRPGGLLLFDVAGPGIEPQPRRTWTAGEDWVVCVEAAEDAPARELTRAIVVFRRAGERAGEGAGDGGAWRRSDERHVLRLYDRDELVCDLQAAGFADVEALGAWGSLGLRPGHVALAARRPAG
jgi:SAM-dependent methyltransferase